MIPTPDPVTRGRNRRYDIFSYSTIQHLASMYPLPALFCPSSVSYHPSSHVSMCFAGVGKLTPTISSTTKSHRHGSLISSQSITNIRARGTTFSHGFTGVMRGCSKF
ncbi:hypothetical protein NA56DRAFT_423032 [Hyaloscypha hepaticicola]|uniref:Uncharacterized protein n=1 Tax=Hyaloscypha hepaticicola TaxID=2082293 RepID=A0A2J6PHE3_9HELO|nr:hypothetical protein NA56DRAFT_423032 [Hyaloscypha hepaticicola]